jgi:hypothetical protein
VLSRGKHRIDLLQQSRAASGRHDASAATFEQRRTKRLLNFLHLMRQPRRTDVHRPRGTVEAAMAMDSLHQREVAQRNGCQVSRNHRTLHVIKGVCMRWDSASCCSARWSR